MSRTGHSLELQAEQAPDFLAKSWPAAHEQAAAGGQLPSTIRSILICGCGDSHHAAASLELAVASASGRFVRAAPAMEAARYLLPQFVRDPASLLLIAISASGEVARTLEAVELARREGAQTLALTTQAGSSLAQAAHRVLSLPIPELPPGPGLLSYLASLLMGYALSQVWGQQGSMPDLARSVADLPQHLGAWISQEAQAAAALAEEADPAVPIVFLGSGPAYGSAMFAAAKVIEASGAMARGQEVEEWGHLEYFCNPAASPWWLLSAAGRAAGREDELIEAAHAVGRLVQVSRWQQPAADRWLRELLAPLALWAGPAAFASRLMQRLGERPFRGFGGGRDREQGGAPSRIRSSQRWSDLSQTTLEGA